MKELFLVRHGQAAAGASLMDRDYCLTDAGVRQAGSLGRKLFSMNVRPSVIYCSVLTRAQETARILSKVLNAPVHPRRDIIEHGSEVFLEECSIEEAIRRFPEKVDAKGDVVVRRGCGVRLNWDFCVGGEDLRSLHRRARGAWHSLLRDHPEPNGTIVLVAHGSLLSALLTEAFDLCVGPMWKFEFANCGFVHLRFVHPAPGECHAFICADGPEGEPPPCLNNEGHATAKAVQDSTLKECVHGR
jgi:broad specificity phosphatase PhoE